MYAQELVKGTVTTLILKLLSSNGKMYGYEITQSLKEASGGKLNLTLAAIYPVLHKLKANGELTTEKQTVGKRVRIYYSLTDKGNATAREKIREFGDYLSTMSAMMEWNKGLRTITLT